MGVEATPPVIGDARERRRMLERLLRERAAEDGAGGSRFARYVNPELAQILSGLCLDKSFVRGDGCWLFDARGERYLDATAGYGSVPFGHAPAEIWDALTGFRDEATPTFVQPSLLERAGELAQRLVAVAPDGLGRVTFANSGAEAIEVALKLARSATGKQGILATDDGFHGKTLGALSATGRAQYQVDFGAPVPGFDRVPFGDIHALEAAIAGAPERYAAFVVEPIQGEGGVNVPPIAYLRAVRELCSQHGVLLILDEVQTGLGRTGRVFACEHEGIAPDVMTLAKALGGGVVPAAAVLCRPELATETFALRHTSTFAGNALACTAGIRTLDLLTRDDGALLRSADELGRELGRSLRELQRRHPAAITAVRGRGLLLGVELTNDIDAFGRQCLVGSMAASEALGPLVCSYLLNVERVRVAPTLFGGRVVRVEPPLVVTREQCEQLVEAFDRTLRWVSGGDAVALLGHLVGRPPRASRSAPSPPPARLRPKPQPGEPRFGFVVHPLDAASFHDFDARLAEFEEDELQGLMNRLDAASSSVSPAAMVVGGGRVESDAGAVVHGELIGLPYTSQHLLELPVARAVATIGAAVELAHERGAEVVGLGAYTSIVTGNARLLRDMPVPVTTGNSLTVAAAVDGVRVATRARGLDLRDTAVAVVGAAGAIGSAVARLVAREAGRLILLGNPAGGEASMRRLEAVAAHIVSRLQAGDHAGAGHFATAARSAAPDALDRLVAAGLLTLSRDHAATVPQADVLITATSTPEPIVMADAIPQGAVVCDIAQPRNVAEAIAEHRPDVTLFEGGVVQMPGRRGLGVEFGLPEGLTYACMAETMVIAFEGDHALLSVGEQLGEATISRLDRLSRAHGFVLAPPDAFTGPGADVIRASSPPATRAGSR